ncbi:putative RNA helicase nonsense mRNA reducing factor [Paratrimastix pyriformis]|uniref:RNA helicase nonsense mRNA reducing factor n=1 Tax=Paratrimastix pyriformis TaxID=342808 RepID=A0ABQ8UUL1_9EUKA|nr:putative RNA helicase nonsense mRNA reducing factor [Paratrimastix pyriformis]
MSRVPDREFQVLWAKKTTAKRIKSWNDGFLTVSENRRMVLRDSDRKIIETVLRGATDIEVGGEIALPGHHVQIDSECHPADQGPLAVLRSDPPQQQPVPSNTVSPAPAAMAAPRRRIGLCRPSQLALQQAPQPQLHRPLQAAPTQGLPHILPNSSAPQRHPGLSKMQPPPPKRPGFVSPLQGGHFDESANFLFPTRALCSSRRDPHNRVPIPDCFATLEEYVGVWSRALLQDFHKELLSLAQRFFAAYQRGLKLNTPGGSEELLPGTAPTIPACPHGQPRLQCVKKEGKNKGRWFYACPTGRCDYFRWAELSASSVDFGNPLSRELFFRSNGLLLHCGCELIKTKRTITPPESAPGAAPSQSPSPAPDGHETVHEETVFYLKLDPSKRLANSEYQKDDLWVFSSTPTFDPAVSPVQPTISTGEATASPPRRAFVMVGKSLWHCPSVTGLLQIAPLGELPPGVFPIDSASISDDCGSRSRHSDASHRSNRNRSVLVDALRGASGLSQLALWEALKLLPTLSIPIMPHIYAAPGTPPPSAASSLICDPFELGQVSRTQVMCLLEETVTRFGLTADQQRVLGQCAAWFHCFGEPPRTPGTGRNVVLVHGVYGSGKSHLLSATIVFLSKLADLKPANHLDCGGTRQGETPSPKAVDGPQVRILFACATNCAVDQVLQTLLRHGFTDFVRVGSLRKIAKPILPHVCTTRDSASRDLADLDAMLQKWRQKRTNPFGMLPKRGKGTDDKEEQPKDAETRSGQLRTGRALHSIQPKRTGLSRLAAPSSLSSAVSGRTEDDDDEAIEAKGSGEGSGEGATTVPPSFRNKRIEEEIRYIQEAKRKIRLGRAMGIAARARVVGTTCVASSLPVLDQASFQIVLLDECSQMTEPMSLLPIVRSKACARLLCVGDPLQLPPVNVDNALMGAAATAPATPRPPPAVAAQIEEEDDLALLEAERSTEAPSQGRRAAPIPVGQAPPTLSSLSRSSVVLVWREGRLEILDPVPRVGDLASLDPLVVPRFLLEDQSIGAKTLFFRLAKAGLAAPVILRTQFRCHPLISNMANELFYCGLLSNGVTAADRPPLIAGLPPVLFVNCTQTREVSDQMGSFINMGEAEVIAGLVHALAQQLESLPAPTGCSIGVIAPYRAQVALLKKLIAERFMLPMPTAPNAPIPASIAAAGLLDIHVSTVDAFQGNEKDLIIMSTCRTHRLGFIVSPPRLNVSITRARRHLIIVGHAALLSENPLWQETLSRIRATGPGSCAEAERFTVPAESPRHYFNCLHPPNLSAAPTSAGSVHASEPTF